MTSNTARSLMVFLMAVGLSLSAFAQPSPQEQQKMIEAYMKMAAVNENHTHLKYFTGKWNVTSKGWMFPGSEPVASEATIQGDLVLGGRFVMMRFKGAMFGAPYEGLQIRGYDNLQKKYVTFWIDSTSTAFYLMSGIRDEKANERKERGLWPDPMTGGDIGVRAITKIISKDEFMYEMFMRGPDGKGFKVLEYHARRAR